MIRSELDVLLEKVQDPALRADLRSQIDRLKERRSFGLVFERHIPERVRLPQHPVRVGSHVVNRDEVDSPTFEVLGIDGGVAALSQIQDAEGAYVHRGEHEVGGLERGPLESLVVISDFDEPVVPGLRLLGSLERGGDDKPYHVVIKGENHHALEALRFTHAGKVDCIYIDPPYNSGARDWKYNNDYVDENDAYRHSKWLAFMERRLKLARTLLNPDDSVLIVTIDEKEYLRLGLLLEQTFPEAVVEMVTSVVNPRGRHRPGRFARSEEYIYFVLFGRAVVGTEADEDFVAGAGVPWRTLRRSDAASARGTAKGGPAQFYPIYVNKLGQIEEIGKALPIGMPRAAAPHRPGCTAVFPIRDSGLEMNWGLIAPALREIHARGFVRVGRHTPSKPQQFEISYFTAGKISDIDSGAAVNLGRRDDGSAIAQYVVDKRKSPTSTWSKPSHNAEVHGTELLAAFVPGRRFPFPKSLYAVEDALRLFVRHKPEAIVLDFFAGSGTTVHAVARLNRQDGGRRQSIMVTNNEVSADEAKDLRARGLRPGDPDWEALGIFEHVTRPRVTAAITGKTPEGQPVAGDYKYADAFPMAEGFEENVAFYELRYLDPDDVDLGSAFDDIAPLMWLRAGATGRVVGAPVEQRALPQYVWTGRYGVLFNEDRWRRFLSERPESACTAFIVTDSPTTFAGVAAELPTDMEVVRLPDSYLSIFLPDRGRA